MKGTTHDAVSANIPACVADTLSAIFYVGTRPLVVGQKVRFPLADSMRTVTVGMKVEGEGRDQGAGGDVPDGAGAADGGRRHREEPREHLDLVHGRCASHAGADPSTAVLGDDYVSPAERRGKVSRSFDGVDTLDDGSELVMVGRFQDPVEAQMARGMLESQGIECVLQGVNTPMR